MKKHHWHAFWHEKLFKKHSQPYCQTRLQDKDGWLDIFHYRFYELNHA
jgi:hypothetical protein